MIRVSQVKVRTNHTGEQLKQRTAELLKLPVREIRSLRIVRQSIDARKKPELFYTYTVDVDVKDEEKLLRRFRGKENQVGKAPDTAYQFPKPGKKRLEHPVVIAGMGPAGLFCGYFLALHGYRPVLLERGKCVEERKKDVERFWESGVLEPDSNVQFGEGGAGAFSDGKLNTLVKDRDGRNGVVLETLVKFGAKRSICYEAKPHIGTDVLSDVVRAMREEILRLGGTVRFESRVTELLVEGGRVSGVVINDRETLACDQLVLAIGHSARDTFSMLYEKQIPMEPKAFAVGLRVEHPQAMINESQYGTAEPGDLGAAPYKVAAKASNGRSVYSFCMCPGGYVVNASSEEGYTAVNGMSYSGRGGQNANSAVIVSVTPEDFPDSHPLAGITFQRMLERRAYELGGGKIPAQRYGDFKCCVERRRAAEEISGGAQDAAEAGNPGKAQEGAAAGNSGGIQDAAAENRAEQRPGEQGSAAAVTPQCKGAFVWADVSRILPEACNEAFVEGMEAFGRQVRGFDREDAVLLGVESRTSSPVRICRDETLQSAVRGLYPCGEGAGYAGGITSAAMDGLRVAERIAAEYNIPFSD